MAPAEVPEVEEEKEIGHHAPQGLARMQCGRTLCSLPDGRSCSRAERYAGAEFNLGHSWQHRDVKFSFDFGVHGAVGLAVDTEL